MATTTIAEQFVAAVATTDTATLEGLLAESAVVRLFDEDGIAAHRPARFVVDALMELRSAWMPESLEFFQPVEGEDASAVDFRVQLRHGAGIADLNGAAFLTLSGGKVSVVALYFGKILPSMQRFGIVQANMTSEERAAFVEAFPNRWDFREFFPSNMRLRRADGVAKVWTNVAHPGSNYVRLVNWTEDEADRRIEETKQWYRERGLGIQWTVGPFDTPGDLRERLERAGFVLAGDQALMARYGLESLDDVPTNPEIEVIDLKQAPEHWEASLQINATAFQWSPEQTENEREGWFEDLETEPIRSVMALVDGKPVADAHLYLQSGVAYLGGAATLPEYRNRKIYSTLLRRRLEIARAEGYEVAVIHAEPMSRRVVSRFGFETQAMYYVYGWMEPMDLDVIRTLVQDQ